MINSPISGTELKLVQFWLFLPKFGCCGNSLDSLEILDSVFEFADPENLTISAKKISAPPPQARIRPRMSWRGSGNFGPFRLHFLPGRGRVQTCDIRRLVCEFCDVIWTVSTTAGRVFCSSLLFRDELAVSRRPTPSSVVRCCFSSSDAVSGPVLLFRALSSAAVVSPSVVKKICCRV